MTDHRTPHPQPPVPRPPQPRTKPRRDGGSHPVIPKGLLIGMGALIATALSIVTYATLTDQPLAGVPHAAAVVTERPLILDGNRMGEVVVRDPAGGVLLDRDAERAGFVSVIWRGLDRKRLIHQVEGNPPVMLTEYANGRLSVRDPATGWSAELASFGHMNEAIFASLLH